MQKAGKESDRLSAATITSQTKIPGGCSPGISDRFRYFPLVGQRVGQRLFADQVARKREGAFVGEP